LRIYFLSERDGMQVIGGLTGGLTILLILKKPGASRVAKWLKRRYMF